MVNWFTSNTWRNNIATTTTKLGVKIMPLAEKMVKIAQHRADLSRQMDGAATKAEREYISDVMEEQLDRLMYLDGQLQTLVKYRHMAEDANIIATKVLESHNVRTGYDMAIQLNTLSTAMKEVLDLLEISYEECDGEVWR